MERILQNDRREKKGAWLFLRRSASRTAAFALLWWVLTEGDPGSWMIGVPAVIGATLASLKLVPDSHWRWRLVALARFLSFFLWQSVRGSIDVSWRALHPKVPLAPQVLNYELRLPDGLGRVVLANTTSLLPGTLSADLQNGNLIVHVLDGSLPLQTVLQALETHVADVLGVELTPHASLVERPHD